MVAMLIAYILDCPVVEYTIDKLNDLELRPNQGNRGSGR
jgi:hypothetical protein